MVATLERAMVTFEPVMGGRRVRAFPKVDAEGMCVKVLAPPMPKIASGGEVIKTYHFTLDQPVHHLPTDPVEYDITGLQVIDQGVRISGFTNQPERVFTVHGDPNASGIYEQRYIQVARRAIVLN